MKAEDYIKLIEDLNTKVFEEHGETEEQFYYTTTGYIDVIGFGDMHLWNSEDDGREFNEDKGMDEPMKPYILRLLRTIGDRLVLIGATKI